MPEGPSGRSAQGPVPTYHRIPTGGGVRVPDEARGRAGRTARRTEARDVIPVVFVHGTRTSSAIWHQQVSAVREAGHAALAVDLPGHGRRTGERFTLGEAVATIDRAVDSVPGPVLLVGLSLGGYASLAFAARHPRKVAGLVLAGCSTEIRGKPLAAYRALSLRIARTLRPTGHTWHVVADMLAAMRGYSALADLRGLRVPVWLVNGVRDPLRLDEWRFLLAHPHARLHVVPRAGHDVNSHAPLAFNRVLLRALRETTAGLHAAGPTSRFVASARS